MNASIIHFSTCKGDYPEKPDGEPWQFITRIGRIFQCSDCGAFSLLPYTDLVAHNFRDETSQFDPSGEWQGGTECYMREYTAYIPARLLRRRPDLVDDFIAKHHEEEWLWSGVIGEPQ